MIVGSPTKLGPAAASAAAAASASAAPAAAAASAAPARAPQHGTGRSSRGSSSSSHGSRGNAKRCKNSSRSPSRYSVHSVSVGGLTLMQKRMIQEEDDADEDEMDVIQRRQATADFADSYHMAESEAGGEDWIDIGDRLFTAEFREEPSPTYTEFGGDLGIVGSPTKINLPRHLGIFSHSSDANDLRSTEERLSHGFNREHPLSIDVRWFYDPHAGELKKHDGRHPDIMEVLARHKDFLKCILKPCKRHLEEHCGGRASIAFFCNRGKHRSMAAAELLERTPNDLPMAGASNDIIKDTEHISLLRHRMHCRCGVCGRKDNLDIIEGLAEAYANL